MLLYSRRLLNVDKTLIMVLNYFIFMTRVAYSLLLLRLKAYVAGVCAVFLFYFSFFIVLKISFFSSSSSCSLDAALFYEMPLNYHLCDDIHFHNDRYQKPSKPLSSCGLVGFVAMA